MKLLVGLAAAALALAVALAPPAIATPQVQVEKYMAPDVALLDQAAPELAFNAKITPLADKAAGKKSGEKDEATSSRPKGRAELVAYPLRL